MSDSPTERALQLLALLARAAEPMSAKAMAEALELPLSTAYRH
ncbi:helix-turn-helix domain-containing protein, partial [Undibacterium luofuense]